MASCETYWNECLKILKDNLTESAFNTWFARIVPQSFDHDTLILQVPSQFCVEYIEENYIDLLSKTLFRVFGKGINLEYRILIDSNSGTGPLIPSNGTPKTDSIVNEMPMTPTAFSQKPAMPALDPQLNPDLSFLSFVQGESNKLARTAGVAIANNPGRTSFNPLFVYGGSGVGKTHLANAIGNQVKQNFPNMRVLYVSAHVFQTQYQDAVIYNHVNDFLNFYQTIDVLIVDDIQYWADKKGTQGAFFQIFNYLHQTGKQIILTSDKAPLELKDLEQRLLTRFKWGLSVEITKPDFALRKDILKNKIYRDGLTIPEDVVDFIANNVRDNVRDLEGVLVSLLAYSTLTDEEINMALAQQVVARLVQICPQEVSIDRITEVVCSHYNVTPQEVISKSRNQEVSIARFVSMFMAKKLTQKPLAEIGKQFGGRNHATVLHALNSIQERLTYDKMLERSIKTIENELKK